MGFITFFIFPISSKYYEILEQYFLDHSNDMSKARFACMDTANVNSRETGAYMLTQTGNTSLKLGGLWKPQASFMF